MIRFAKILISVVASLSATAAAALDVCEKNYWPYSEFIEAPAPFGGIIGRWPDADTARQLIQSHHEQVSIEYRNTFGPCQPTSVPRFMDAMFGGIFNRNEEERLRATNGFYRVFSQSCHIVDWNNIDGRARSTLGVSPHVLRYSNTSDAMCGPNAVFLSHKGGLISFQMEGGSCDMLDFRADRIRAISLNSVFDGVHTADSILERLYDYIGEGPQISMVVYGPGSPDHTKLGVTTISNGRPMFPPLFSERAEPLPFGRHYEGRYYLIYPTLNNPRGEGNRFFPTFTSSLRIDIVDVTEGEKERRFYLDACRKNQDNTDQPIMKFR